jgi:Rrf2 family transcriptional regulator, nitric oxide-sensitive transcriptional repressor
MTADPTMRLTVKTNIAMRTLMCCAVNPDTALRKSDIALACNASENHLAQVISQLSAEGLLRTLRGRNGGVSLGRPADEITVGEVFRLLEQSVPFVECFDIRRNTCPLASCCRLRTALKQALQAFYASLDQLTLADLIEGNCQLMSLLAVREALEPDCRTRGARQIALRA